MQNDDGGGKTLTQRFRLLRERARQWLEKHGRKLWWFHSVYALGLGAFVIAFAQKGFERTRMLVPSLGLAWLLVIVLFRVSGEGRDQRGAEAQSPKMRLRFLAMTYVLKNLYQGMLFFLLPFYWKSATLDAPNALFFALLALSAVLSTVDIVFDRVVMRWRAFASVLHALTLFACLNLVVPALLPETRTLYTLVAAGIVTMIGFWTLHVPFEALRDRLYVLVLATSVACGAGIVFIARSFIPPVPMYLAAGAVGPEVLADGRLAMEVRTLHASVIRRLLVVTDVVIPGGKGDRLRHVWRKDGVPLARTSEETARVSGPRGTVRLRSSLEQKELPSSLAGQWSVDVETEDGQLVGRVKFAVTQ